MNKKKFVKEEERKLYSVKLADRINGEMLVELRNEVGPDVYSVVLVFRRFNADNDKEHIVCIDSNFENIDEAIKTYKVLRQFVRCIFKRTTEIYMDEDDLVKEVTKK